MQNKDTHIETNKLPLINLIPHIAYVHGNFLSKPYTYGSYRGGLGN